MKHLFFAFLLLSGCATVKMDETKAISQSCGFFGGYFCQDGKTLEYDDTIAKMSRLPEAKKQIATANVYRWSALGMTLGGLLLADLADNGQDRVFAERQNAWGLGLILLSIPVNVLYIEKLGAAVEIWNNSLARTPTVGFTHAF